MGLVDGSGALESGVTAGVGTSLAQLSSPSAIKTGGLAVEVLSVDTLTLKLSVTGCVD